MKRSKMKPTAVRLKVLKPTAVRLKMSLEGDWAPWFVRLHATGIVHLVEGTALSLGLFPFRPEERGWQELQRNSEFASLLEYATLKFADPACIGRVHVPPEFVPPWRNPVFVKLDVFFAWATSVCGALPPPLAEWLSDPEAVTRRARVSLISEYDEETGMESVPEDKQYLLRAAPSTPSRAAGVQHERALATARNVLAAVVLSNHAKSLRGAEPSWAFLPPVDPSPDHQFAEFSTKPFCHDRETVKTHIAKAIVDALGPAYCQAEFPALAERAAHSKKGLKV